MEDDEEENPIGTLYAKFPHARTFIKDRLHAETIPYREIYAYYRCAMMIVENKFKVLSEELSLEYDHNPIETVKSRMKSLNSVMDKLVAKKIPLSVENIEEHVKDVAGIRVICGFPSDIYALEKSLLKQDDITLLERKDYIENPKENGYRSLHLIVSVPVFLYDKTKEMKVEVQLRTISMDWWASLEHKIRYKKDVDVPGDLSMELKECAEAAAELDDRMENIRLRIDSLGEK